MEKINISPINKTTVFYTYLESNDCLVRTGTIKDELLCFFHSILLCCSKSFKRMNDEDRFAMIKNVRNIIFEKINKNEWKNKGVFLFKKTLASNLIDFYSFINTDEKITNQSVKKIGKQLITSKKQFELFKIITEILPTDIINDIQITDDMSIEECKKLITHTVKNYLISLDILNELNDENSDHIINNICEFTKLILNETEYISFKNYKCDNYNIDSNLVNIVSNYFNCNIYFIDSNTRLPYIINDIENFTHLNSIILLKIDPDHYESVGKLTHGNNIIREFADDDSIIVTIKNKLNKPLKEFEKLFNVSKTEDEDESESDEDPRKNLEDDISPDPIEDEEEDTDDEYNTKTIEKPVKKYSKVYLGDDTEEEEGEDL